MIRPEPKREMLHEPKRDEPPARRTVSEMRLGQCGFET